MAAAARNAALALELRTLLAWPPPPPPPDWQSWLADSHVIHDRAAFLVVRFRKARRAQRKTPLALVSASPQRRAAASHAYAPRSAPGPCRALSSPAPPA
jgi:hypothetical protein